MNPEASLPLLYGPWLRAITGGLIPAEVNATCDNCAMLPSPGSSPDASYFHPVTKCCAYQPHLPNFLAGRLLEDVDTSMAEGRQELEARIARRVAITPRWAGPGEVFALLYRNVPRVFGRAPALGCHFLTATGGCGIWKHRPAVCATWFCKYVRGKVGSRFWKLADKLLQTVESDLSLWCLAELGVGSAEVDQATSRAAPDVSELGGDIDWARYRKLWGEWAGREIDFYRDCGRLVEPLTWDQVEQISGPRVRILAELVRDAYASLGSQAIPERLKVGRLAFVGVEGNTYRVVSYSQFDPLLMPEKLATVLHYFDGRPTEEALESILAQQGVRLDLGLVRRMVDFGVLQGCDACQVSGTFQAMPLMHRKTPQ
jgi:hypothetical protein